jgi:hypothetical protein
MICPSCNKFAANCIDSSEPEIDLDVDESGNVTGTCRIVVTSECCGDELKEANFDIYEDFDGDPEELAKHQGEGHELEVEVDTSEVTERTQTHTERTLKDGTVKRTPIKSSRFMRRFYGFEATATIKCSCGGFSEDVKMADEIQASAMDELV